MDKIRLYIGLIIIAYFNSRDGSNGVHGRKVQDGLALHHI